MGPYIEACKERIIDIMNKVRDLYPHYRIKFSVVAYRDFCDIEKAHFETFQFSDNLLDCVNFLENLEAKGGGDIPEDLAGGL